MYVLLFQDPQDPKKGHKVRNYANFVTFHYCFICSAQGPQQCPHGAEVRQGPQCPHGPDKVHTKCGPYAQMGVTLEVRVHRGSSRRNPRHFFPEHRKVRRWYV